MPGPVSRATTRTPAAGFLDQLDDDLAGVGEPHDVARDLRDRGRDDGQVGRARSQAARRARAPPGAPRTMSASAWIGTRTSSSRCCPRSISGSLSRAHRSHSSRWRRRRPRAADVGRRRTGPAAPDGTGRSAARRCSRASRYSTRSRARVRFSCAATAPAVEPAPGERPGVLPGDLMGEQGLPLPLRQPGQRAATAACSSRASRSSSGRRRVGGRRRGAGCAGAGRCSRHIDATTLRAVTIAYGSSIPGSTRGRAARTRTRVSCTRSSAAAGPSRAPDDAAHHRDQRSHMLLAEPIRRRVVDNKVLTSRT